VRQRGGTPPPFAMVKSSSRMDGLLLSAKARSSARRVRAASRRRRQLAVTLFISAPSFRLVELLPTPMTSYRSRAMRSVRFHRAIAGKRRMSSHPDAVAAPTPNPVTGAPTNTSMTAMDSRRPPSHPVRGDASLPAWQLPVSPSRLLGSDRGERLDLHPDLLFVTTEHGPHPVEFEHARFDGSRLRPPPVTWASCCCRLSARGIRRHRAVRRDTAGRPRHDRGGNSGQSASKKASRRRSQVGNGAPRCPVGQGSGRALVCSPAQPGVQQV
jgi:hypothetical protein